MKKSKPEVSKILGPVLRETIVLLFDLNRFAEKLWLKQTRERFQKPRYAYPLRRDSNGRMMKPEMVNN